MTGGLVGRRCACNEWHPVADIGNWLVRPGIGGLVLVRDWARSGGIWEPGRYKVCHEDLTDRIRGAGGITCAYTPVGQKLIAGGVELVDGLQRWVVTTDLGISLVPVEISTEDAESPFA